jgi:tetratricopeptide (TPR) repeat protein
MKKSNRLIFLLLMVPLFSQVNAQKYFNIHRPIVLPDKSPEALVKQTIGYTDISIQYHSPGARGRQIWGGIVPFGQVWRAGANENTVFSITHDAEIEGQILPAGTYGLHLLPEKEEWTFIFSKNHTSWGSYFYDQKEDVLRITVPVETAPEFREWMSFDFHQRDRGEASVQLSWGAQRAGFSIQLDIDQIALENIRLQLRSDAYWEWFSWCQAAAYCAEYEINTDEALEWIDRSIAMQENFSNWDVKSDLLRQKGDPKGAQEAIQRAIEVGTPVYIERYARRFLGKKEYDKAVELFDKALEKDPTYWRALMNKGVALEGMNKKLDALKAYKLALGSAPKNIKQSIEEKIKKLNK